MRSALLSLSPRVRRPPILIAAAWTIVTLVAAMQTVMLVRLNGHVEITRVLIARLAIIPLWAIATPAILRSAGRFPVVAGGWQPSPAHIATHLGLGSLFILATNLVVRIPLVLGPDAVGIAGLWHSTMLGVAEYYPPAILAYGIIVAIGHAVYRRTPPVPALVAEPPAAADDTTAPSDESPTGCLTVRQWNRVHFVRIDDIDWIEAEDNYVVVHASGRSYKGRERLGDVETRLDNRRFVRIHRSSIVHVAKIREVQPLTHGDHAVILRDGKVLRVARSRRQMLEAALAVQL